MSKILEAARNGIFGDNVEVLTVDIILTNKCNLACSYCLEQHDTTEDWTVEKLYKLYNICSDILKNSNKERCTFQFFGGEPLLHKKLILDFVDQCDLYDSNIHLSITTNGLMLDESFCKSWFVGKNGMMGISLDTLDVASDHREITQCQLDRLLDTIEVHIPDYHKSTTKVGIRCTISRETQKGLSVFVDKLYSIGIRELMIHPLILSGTNMDTEITWTDEEWASLKNQVLASLRRYPDFQILFVEGLSDKFGSNCFTDTNMLAINSKGEFGGCYLVPNSPGDALEDYINGNIFEDFIDVEKINIFTKEHKQKRLEHEECKSCNLRGKCYTCPAMSLVIKGDAWAPTSMCKKMVELSLLVDDTNKAIELLVLKQKFLKMSEADMSRKIQGIVYRLKNGSGNIEEENVLSISVSKALELYFEIVTESELESLIGASTENMNKEDLAFYIHYYYSTLGEES